MSYHPSQIANYFLDKADEDGQKLTTLKLLKLIYIAHGWCLATLKRDILGGEAVQAWQHGPVIPSIYHEFKDFGKSPITKKATEYSFSGPDDDIDIFSFELVTPELKDAEVKTVIDYVWSAYKQYSGFDLVNMTHQPETPWSKHYKAGARNVVIPNDCIKDYYKVQISDLIGAANN